MALFRCAAPQRRLARSRRINALCLPVILGAILTSVPAQAAEAADPAAPVVGQETLSGTWGGYRPQLHDIGLDFGVTDILDLFGNPSGGTTQAATLQGRLEVALDVDFEKLINMKSLTGHVNAYQLHGRGMSTSNLNNNLLTVSNIESHPTTRLFDLWLQQNLFDDDLSIRIGQIAADDEFTTTQYGGLFVSSVFGWPSSLAANLPGGGPAFPLATPGARIRIGQTDPWSLQVGVFDGDASGQHVNLNGANFNTSNGALTIAELAYALNNDKNAVGLPGNYKLGMWYHTENFGDQRFDSAGLSLADASSSGNPRAHHGNYGLYGVADQKLWRESGSDSQGLGAFARFMWNPDDRNLAAMQVDAGLNYKGLIPSRPDDSVGIAFSYVGISNRTRDRDIDNNAFTGTNAPLRDYESVIELTYQAPITAALTLQPDFQYIMHPGGNVADPRDASGTSAIKDAAIFGLRLVAKF